MPGDAPVSVGISARSLSGFMVLGSTVPAAGGDSRSSAWFGPSVGRSVAGLSA